MAKPKVLLMLFAAGGFLGGCQPSQRIIEDSRRNAAPPAAAATVTEGATPRDDFEERLESVRRGRFTFVYSFHRQDNEIFTAEDKRILKQNSPAETNQWVLTADQKKIIAGSNYLFTPENLTELKKHFEVTEHSAIIKEPDNQKDANQQK